MRQNGMRTKTVPREEFGPFQVRSPPWLVRLVGDLNGLIELSGAHARKERVGEVLLIYLADTR